MISPIKKKQIQINWKRNYWGKKREKRGLVGKRHLGKQSLEVESNHRKSELEKSEGKPRKST